MKCKKCGANLDDGAYFCSVCGTLSNNTEESKKEQNNQNDTNIPDSNENVQDEKQTVVSETICPNCGNPMRPGENFCERCGTKKDNHNAVNTNNKSNAAVIVLIIVISAILLIGTVTACIILINIITNKVYNQDDAVTPTATATATIIPTAEPAPVFPHISASSVRPVDYTSGTAVYYPVEYAIDGNFETCWSPNRDYGLNPTLTLSADTPQHVKGIRLANGYFKTPETYTKNRIITRAEIIYEGGKKVVDMSTSNYRVMEDIVFDQPVDTTYIQIHVLDTCYGEWKDICISEVEVY